MFSQQHAFQRTAAYSHSQVSKFVGCETPIGDKEGFFYCLILHPHPQTVCFRSMPVWSHHTGAKDDTLWDCAVVLFLRNGCAFPYNREAVLRAEKVQCVAGLSNWRTCDAAPAGWTAVSVGGLRFEGQQACDRGVVQSCNSVGFIEGLFSSVCCSIKLGQLEILDFIPGGPVNISVPGLRLNAFISHWWSFQTHNAISFSS